MKWQQTTLRKNTKSPRICRDMLITESWGKFRFVEVKNGQITTKKLLTENEAKKLIKDNKLIKQKNTVFNNCFTYRDYLSTKLVNELLYA